MNTTQITFYVNGAKYVMSVGDKFGQLKPNETLVDTLRNRLGLTGTKLACDDGACGCCTVLVDDEAVPSCTVLTVEMEGKHITTIEGLSKDGELDSLQQAFVDYYAFQCGYCTPGIIMAAKALLIKNPHPTRTEIQEALSGNFCRCISHYHVIDAIESLVKKGETV